MGLVQSDFASCAEVFAFPESVYRGQRGHGHGKASLDLLCAWPFVDGGT